MSAAQLRERLAALLPDVVGVRFIDPVFVGDGSGAVSGVVVTMRPAHADTLATRLEKAAEDAEAVKRVRALEAAGRDVLMAYQALLDDDDLDAMRDALTVLQEALDGTEATP